MMLVTDVGDEIFVKRSYQNLKDVDDLMLVAIFGCW